MKSKDYGDPENLYSWNRFKMQDQTSLKIKIPQFYISACHYFIDCISVPNDMQVPNWGKNMGALKVILTNVWWKKSKDMSTFRQNHKNVPGNVESRLNSPFKIFDNFNSQTKWAQIKKKKWITYWTVWKLWGSLYPKKVGLGKIMENEKIPTKKWRQINALEINVENGGNWQN